MAKKKDMTMEIIILIVIILLIYLLKSNVPGGTSFNPADGIMAFLNT